MDPGPVLVRQWRNGRVQAVHCGHAVLLGGQCMQWAWGDPSVFSYWRSCAKPLQALPFLGAMEGLDERHLAVAAGSHAAQPEQIRRVQEILASAGVDEDALQCGAHDVDEAVAGPRPAGGWRPLHNNCSGKHAAMLAVCRQRGWDLATYLEPEHPLQQEVHGIVCRATGRTPDEVPVGVDGCGLPTYWTPLEDLARAYRWLATQAAGRRVLRAMGDHPVLYGGSDRFDTRLAQATDGQVVAKIGTLGVHAAVHLGRREALAVRISDGSSLARDALTGALCHAAGWIDEDVRAALGPLVENHAGRVLGRFEVLLESP